jgi:YD repeat-containing protein
MDRRQLLFGMTALGLTGQVDLSQLLSAQTVEGAEQVSAAKQAQLSDSGEEFRLRGPVKMSAYDRHLVTTSEYGRDGKLLSTRTEVDGQLSYSSSDSLYTEIHDSQGRLKKMISGTRGGPARETLYGYDDAGRLAAVANSENSDRLEVHYQADGSKTSIQTFDANTIERTRHSGFAGSGWDAASTGFGVPMGGTVTTIYDADDHPSEIHIRSADGQFVSRIVRTYDAKGRLIEEKSVEQNMVLLLLDRMPPEQRAQLSPAQIQAMNKGLNAFWKEPSGTTIAYDAQGRITETIERNMFSEQTTKTYYNDQGDKARERITFKNNSAVPSGVSYSFDEEGNLIPKTAPQRPEPSYLPSDSDARYDYRYDSYRNWTERVETSADGSSVTTNRNLTYY